MSRIVISVIILLFSLSTTAQWYDPEKVNPKAAAMYAEAITNAQDEKYPNAIKQIQDALKVDPKLVDAYLSLGGIYAAQKNYTESHVMGNCTASSVRGKIEDILQSLSQNNWLEIRLYAIILRLTGIPRQVRSCRIYKFFVLKF